MGRYGAWAAAVLLAAAGTGAANDFEAALGDASAILERSREAVSPQAHDDFISGRHAFDRWSRDCRRVVFLPEDRGAAIAVHLESSLYEQHCVTAADGTRQCRDRKVRTEGRQVRFEVRGRGELLPWEKDEFRVCMQGYDVTAEPYDTAYSYQMQMGLDGTVVAMAGRKLPTESDREGLHAASFGLDESGNFAVELRDKWASYYSGERIALRVELKKHVPMWADETVLKKEISLPTAEAYRIDFGDYAREFAKDLERGQEYFVKWGFVRVGTVSKDNYNGSWDTYRARYQSPEGARAQADRRGWPNLGSLASFGR